MDILKKLFNKESLERIATQFITYAASNAGLTNPEKKQWVVESIVAFQQANLNIKWIPDSIEVMILRFILNTLVEEVYQRIKPELAAA